MVLEASKDIITLVSLTGGDIRYLHYKAYVEWGGGAGPGKNRSTPGWNTNLPTHSQLWVESQPRKVWVQGLEMTPRDHDPDYWTEAVIQQTQRVDNSL